MPSHNGNMTDDSFYRSIIENQSFYIIKTDLQGRYTYMNPYFCLILGISKEDWIGRYSIELIVPEDHAICIETVEKCFAAPDVMQKAILRKPVANGIVINTQWEFSMLKDENGQLSEVLCIGHDITPLIQRQKDLQTLVDITAVQNKRLQDFTYIVSHNIRSHVANLSGILSITDMKDEQSRNESFTLLKNVVGSLDETIYHLHDIISIQGNTNLPECMLNLKEEIEKVLLVIHMSFTSSGASIAYDFEDGEQIHTNQAYFESILLNLFTNCIKYRSLDRSPFIKISLVREGHYRLLTVQDNGRGIDLSKYRDKLFGMYNTFHGNKDAKGLGLFIVKAQIEALKGEIEVKSEVGAGTSFMVYFADK
jgi:PAS domain S-box-containing protein